MHQKERQKADHPHYAAVHLMKALKCCKQCNDSEQIDLMQIRQLQYRKSILSEELKQIKIRGQSITALESQIRDLEQLIVRLKQQNTIVQQQGLRSIQLAIEERKTLENEEMVDIMTQLEAEVNLNKQMKRQMENLMERVRYLNRINNQLVYNFCNY